MIKRMMLIFAFLIGLLSFTSYGTEIQSQFNLPIFVCGVNQYRTPSGCWSSCSSPQYNQCGDIFPTLYNPSFCAYTIDGRYVNYTFECQACKSTAVVAVRSGACDCSFVKCGPYQQCQNGQCIDSVSTNPVDLCLNVQCSAG